MFTRHANGVLYVLQAMSFEGKGDQIATPQPTSYFPAVDQISTPHLTNCFVAP